MEPIRYVESVGGYSIAYQVIGDGPLDIVFVHGWVCSFQPGWEWPALASFYERLSGMGRLILFDKRGTGLSDRVGDLPTLEDRMDDVRAVLDAVGSRQAALLGVSEGGPLCALYATTYPERTQALVMIGTYAKRVWDPDYPWAPTLETRGLFFDEIREHWGGPVGLEERAPSVAADPAFRAWWSTYLRMGASPGAALRLTQMNADINVLSVLPLIRVPTLILHRTDDRCLRVEEGRYMAGMIPDARFVELPGEDHLPFVGDQDAMLDEIEQFLTGSSRSLELDRVLATVMCVCASATADEGRGAASPDPIERFYAHARKELEWFRGGGFAAHPAGFISTFDGPARAIRCASALSAAAPRFGVDVRIGLHTGECDVRNDKITGVAVDTAAQVAGHAAPSEVLVSRTVKDLVAGSGLRFEDHGKHALDGVTGGWRLYAVERGVQPRS